MPFQNQPTAFITEANSTTSSITYSYYSSRKAITGNALLIFRDVSNEFIELIIIEKPWSKEPTILFEEIRFDEGHKYDDAKPHLKIDICKSLNKSENESLLKKSIIANKILKHRIGLDEQQISEIKADRVNAIYKIITEKIKADKNFTYEVCCVSKTRN